MRLARTLVAAAACSVLGACGGGGGESEGAPAVDDQPVASTLDFPVDAAITRLFVEGGTFDVYGPDPTDPTGTELHLREEWMPAHPESLDGKVWMSADNSLSLSGANVLLHETQRFLFSTAPLRVEAVLRPGFSDVHVGSQGELPTSAKVGASGPFMQYGAWDLATSVEPISRTIVRWSLRADTAQTALACIEAEQFDVATAASATEASCYRIDAAGAILGMEFDVTVNGQTLEFR